MIKATIKYNGFRVEGHADYAPSGYDIVCAGVSTLVATVLTSAYGIVDENEINKENGIVDVTFTRMEYEDRVLLKALAKGLKLIHEQYPRYLEVKYEA
ncbi:MAG: ribosomal-processing cysteine protease Prp [Cellulosilyticaceae bacterium]